MTDKIRVTIYVDGGLWDAVKLRSWKRRKSASLWLEELISGHFHNGVGSEPKLCEYCDKEHDPRVACPEYEKTRKPDKRMTATEVLERSEKAGVPRHIPSTYFTDEVVKTTKAVESFEKTYDKTATEIIAGGQVELDSKRKGRDIRKDKIEGRKTPVLPTSVTLGEPVESLTKFSGAYSKSHQTRKKGK